MKNSNTQLPISTKGKRGRPRKNPLPEITKPILNDLCSPIKRKRGRPKKHPKQTEDDHFDKIQNELSDLNDDEYQIIDKVKKEKKADKPDKKKYYVDNNRLTELIMIYYKDNIIPDELAIYLFNIATRISFMPNFINYTWKEEMIGDGLVKEFLALKNKKFNPEKGKAFSYFSMIVYNAFCNRIKKEIKEKTVIKEYQEDQYATLMPEGHGRIITTNEDHDSGDYE